MFIRIYLTMAIVFIYSMLKTRRALHMLQQNLYNENNRYIKWLLKNIKQFAGVDLITIPIALIGIFVIYDLETIAMLSIISIIILLLATAFIWRRNINNDQNKKKLVITARIKRLIFTTTIISLIPVITLIISDQIM